jgi:7,8-dihydropterin-6-yl-methyl-4-(beta-D-ribofuranosyl)aminobenzene 5'-phosphate synthase
MNHELAMMLIENDEIVLFSGCSHSGIINIIEEVKLFSRSMRIKATFSVFHYNDPESKMIETQEFPEVLNEAEREIVPVSQIRHSPEERDTILNTGRIGKMIQTMYTGEVIEL